MSAPTTAVGPLSHLARSMALCLFMLVACFVLLPLLLLCGPFQFDLRNLLVVNPHQIDEDGLANDGEEYLKGQAQAAVQSLINRRARLEPPGFLTCIWYCRQPARDGKAASCVQQICSSRLCKRPTLVAPPPPAFWRMRWMLVVPPHCCGRPLRSAGILVAVPLSLP